MNRLILQWTCCILGLLVLSGCPTKTAGGSSEETNTIAGVLVDGSGKPVANALVSIQMSTSEATPTVLAKASVSSVVYVSLYDEVLMDTTDGQGRWSVKPTYQGAYTILAKDSTGRLMIREVDFDDSVRVQDTMQQSRSLDLNLACRFGSPRGSVVAIPGTPYAQAADSLGHVHFDSLPQGRYTIMLRSADPFRYADQRMNIDLRSSEVPSLWGPFQADAFFDSTARSQALQATPSFGLDTIWFPLVYAYEVRAWWNFDALQPVGQILKFVDARGRSGDGVVYSGTSDSGIVNTALHLQNASQFGVVEDAGSTFDSLGPFSVEAWVKIQQLPDSAGYQMNLVGKLGLAGDLSGDLFSLAVVRDSTDSLAHFAFLLSDGQSGALDSADRVKSSATVALGTWTYVMASWDGISACLYVDGVQAGCGDLGVRNFATTTVPVYFGKENMDLVLDEVRIIGINLGVADARYRWLRRFP